MKLLMSFILLLFFVKASQAQEVTVRIGAKNFTEQFLLASITKKYLAANGFEPKLTTGLGTLVMRKALELNQLDLVWDYTGTALIVYYHLEEKLTGLPSYERIRDLDAKVGLTWLPPSTLDNGYAITMQRSIASKLNIRTLEDLANHVNKEQKEEPQKKHLFALDYEFASRPDGLKPFEKAYGLTFKRSDIKPMDPGLVYTALRKGQVLAGIAFNSDGRIAGFDLVALEDNRKYFPAYYVTPVVRKDFLDKHPRLGELLTNISKKLNTDKMRKLNKRVDIDHKSVEKVASEFLTEEGLL